MGTDSPAMWLSETGCFVGESLTPVSSLVPYEVQSPLWTDGAEKRRYLTLPVGSTLSVGTRGSLLLPPGGVLIKEFLVDERRVETRFLSRDFQGEWHFATYVWEGDDARLVEGGEELTLEDTEWTVPSLDDCVTCHANASERSIGFTWAQLDEEHDSSAQRSDPLAALVELGWLSQEDANAAEESTLPLVAPDSEAEPSSRARSYLQGNCAFCHDGSVVSLDLSYDIALEDMGVCNTPPEYGDLFVDGARLLAPGDPEASLLLLRMQTELESWRMPMLGGAEVDAFGVELVTEWIRDAECP